MAIAYTVRSGDTLSQIATAHGITLARLLDANPRFKANPDFIRVGDVLTIPGVEGPAPAPPTPVQPQPPMEQVLGALSERFETGGRGPGTVSSGVGDLGGVSYGSYQMTSRPDGGTVARFVAQSDFPFRELFAGLAPGSATFTAEWTRLARTHRDAFRASQHEFIKRTHFDPLVRKIVRDDRVNVLTRSAALQDVIWSTAVQHGAGSSIPHRALAAVNVPPDDADFDRRFIVAIYAERGRRNANGDLVHFSRSSPAVQRSVARRFREEERMALEMLANELPV